MHRRLFDIYQRKRIININVNIISAGMIALGFALIPVHYTRKMGIDNELAITAIGTTFDVIFDVAIFYALHWIANHWNPWWSRGKPKKPRRAYFRDATLIQFERALFAPLYYVISSSVNYSLQRAGTERELAFASGFFVGLAITRVAHTLWGIKTGRFLDEAPEQDKSDQANQDQADQTESASAQSESAPSEHPSAASADQDQA